MQHTVCFKTYEFFSSDNLHWYMWYGNLFHTFQTTCKESIFHWILSIPALDIGEIQMLTQFWVAIQARDLWTALLYWVIGYSYPERAVRTSLLQTECNVLVVKVLHPVWVTLVVHSWSKSMVNICSSVQFHGAVVSVTSTQLVTIATGAMLSVATGSKKILVCKNLVSKLVL